MSEYEHATQVALFQWASLNTGKYPELEDLFAIPNGGKRDKRTAAKMRAEGVKAGMPDICLPHARGGYHAYYIELKVTYPDGSRNGTSNAQDDRIDRLRAAGNKVCVYWDWMDAAYSLIDYLEEQP
jgi:hypothetical protein